LVSYVDSRPPTGTTKRGTKRGSSATQNVLRLCSTVGCGKDSDGHPSIWRQVYALMQCPGPPCDLGPHCWISPIGKKYYKLRTHHLRALIGFVEQGNSLQSHDDVPDHTREQLVAEEQQRLARQPNAPANAPTPLPPINITNMLPSSHQPSIAGSVDSTGPPDPAPCHWKSFYCSPAPSILLSNGDSSAHLRHSCSVRPIRSG
jgi:hypothetical protein